MAEQANLEEDKASWTIKSVPVETRKLAVACAANQGQTMAEWLAKAVRTQANLEAGERVLPPAPRPGDALAAWAPVPSIIGLGGLADLMQAAREIAEAGRGADPKATARHALGANHGTAPGGTGFASQANPPAKRANHR